MEQMSQYRARGSSSNLIIYKSLKINISLNTAPAVVVVIFLKIMTL